MTAPPLVVADIGNTALKVVSFGPRGAARGAGRLPLARGASARSLRLWFASRPRPSVVVSVHGGHLALLEEALGPLAVLGRDLPLGMENRTRRPGETGADRLCAAAAAFARARGPAVALGVGTALTADAVDAGGAFLGGAIAPGLRAAAAGLRAAAPALPGPDLRAGGGAPFPGRTTAGALRAGFLLGFAGLADRLAAEAAAAARPSRGRGEPPVPVFLHGGDAPAILPFLRSRVRAAPHLVAEGARILWLRGPGG